MKAAVKEKRPPAQSRGYKIFVIAGSLAILILGMVTFYSYRMNIKFRKDFEGMLQNKEAEFKEQLSKQRDMARKDMEEKYKADKVSYDAMIRRLDIEKEEAKKLKEKQQRS